MFGLFDQNVTLTLIMPAIAVTLVFFAVLFGVPETTSGGRSWPAGMTELRLVRVPELPSKTRSMSVGLVVTAPASELPSGE